MKNNVVIILGAGASVAYGYPTGKELADKICDGYSLKQLHDMINDWGTAKKAEYLHGLNAIEKNFNNAGRDSIDSWLTKEDNKDFIPAGKLIIAYFISQKEIPADFLGKFRRTKYYDPDKHPKDWYRLLLKEMDRQPKLKDFGLPNIHLSIITFNYDRSLEFYLLTTLQSTYGAHNLNEIWKQLDNLDIIHVYGTVGDLPRPGKSESDYIKYRTSVKIQELVKRAEKIQIFPELCETQSQKLKKIRSILVNADKIYFIGFGYNEDNLKILGFPLHTPLQSNKLKIKLFGSTYGMGTGEINRAKFNTRISVKQRPNNLIKLNNDGNDYNEDAYLFFKNKVIEGF